MIGRLVKLSVLVGLAGVVVGVWLGSTRATLGPAPLKTVDATATYENGFGRASTEDDEQQFVFDVRRIPWVSGSKVGKGDPPCLRTPGRKADVEIGYRDIRLPDGRTTADVALWIRCR
ncbi:hypothetical protein [Nocardioides cavernaquae]|uniref:Uncharacterized protein n=1 Tax=Nocardioides cavernaquae TaxID=2321396 RepID=A0A3A5H3G2_9ACTN|nr:hypothetical protein [Nocardioides cavernaquae]RJS45309.1 hypothetical protein D4739_03150 [Nocardioides cavernaquae]